MLFLKYNFQSLYEYLWAVLFHSYGKKVKCPLKVSELFYNISEKYLVKCHMFASMGLNIESSV